MWPIYLHLSKLCLRRWFVCNGGWTHVSLAIVLDRGRELQRLLRDFFCLFYMLRIEPLHRLRHSTDLKQTLGRRVFFLDTSKIPSSVSPDTSKDLRPTTLPTLPQNARPQNLRPRFPHLPPYIYSYLPSSR